MMDQRGNNIDPQISQMDDKQFASSVKSADEFPSPCARRGGSGGVAGHEDAT
jgi:hypothetical protein